MTIRPVSIQTHDLRTDPMMFEPVTLAQSNALDIMIVLTI